MGSSKTSRWLIWLAFVLLFIFTIRNLPDLKPHGMHSWAQSDRYALACQYFHNLNFFEPATYNLMSEDGRVGVEFPLLPYLSALIAQPFGLDSTPFIMRLLNLLILLVSVDFLIRRIRGSVWLKMPVILSVMFSPVLFFYSFNFLPDTTGLAFLLFAFGHLLRLRDDPNRDWKIVVLSGIATLFKTSCGIYFLALTGAMFLQRLIVNGWKSSLRIALIGLPVMVAIIGYDYFFFWKVNKAYWAVIFMSESQPIETLDQWMQVRKSFLFWFGQWITVPTILLAVLLTFFRFRVRHGRSFNVVNYAISLSVVGIMGFVLLMGNQFVNHDYYFIAVFTPLVFLFLAAMTDGLEDRLEVKPRWQMMSVRTAAILCCSISAVFGMDQHQQRSKEIFDWRGRQVLNETRWMANGDEELNDMGIEEDAKVFVCYVFAPNTSLVYFNRRGRVFNHEEMTREPENIEYWFNRIKPDFVIIPKKWLSHLKRDQPEFNSRLRLWNSTDSYVVYTTDQTNYQDGYN